LGESEHTVQTLDARVVESNDEGRGVGATSTEETRFIVGDQEANDGERSDVDDSLRYDFFSDLSGDSQWRELTIRQKVPLTAAGMVLRGSGVSEAASPTSSVPAKENAAVTNTEQTPLKPLANAPGLLQLAPPM